MVGNGLNGSNASLHPSVRSEPVFLHETARVASIAGGGSSVDGGESVAGAADGLSLVSSPAMFDSGRSVGSTVQYKRKTTSGSVWGGFFGKRRTVIDVGAFRKMPNG